MQDPDTGSAICLPSACQHHPSSTEPRLHHSVREAEPPLVMCTAYMCHRDHAAFQNFIYLFFFSCPAVCNLVHKHTALPQRSPTACAAYKS